MDICFRGHNDPRDFYFLQNSPLFGFWIGKQWLELSNSYGGQLMDSKSKTMQGENMVLFVFDNSNNVDRIILNQPWSLDKHIVMLQKYTTYGLIQVLDFTNTLFWIQVHDIPI